MYCGPGCSSSTTKGAIIYFPPGTYLVSSTIETYYGTQFIGDVSSISFICLGCYMHFRTWTNKLVQANSRPIIKAAASFIGLGVISTNHYVENGGTGSDGNAKQWYINTVSHCPSSHDMSFRWITFLANPRPTSIGRSGTLSSISRPLTKERTLRHCITKSPRPPAFSSSSLKLRQPQARRSRRSSPRMEVASS